MCGPNTSLELGHFYRKPSLETELCEFDGSSQRPHHGAGSDFQQTWKGRESGRRKACALQRAAGVMMQAEAGLGALVAEGYYGVVMTWALQPPQFEVKWKPLSCVWLFVTHGLYSPWNSPGQDTRVGSLSLLQGIFPTHSSNPGLPHCRRILYQLSHKGSQ